MHAIRLIVASALFSATFALPLTWPSNQLLSVRQKSGTLVQREDAELFSRAHNGNSKLNTPASTTSSLWTSSTVRTTSSPPSSYSQQSRDTTPRQSSSGSLPQNIQKPARPSMGSTPRSQTSTPDSLGMSLLNLNRDGTMSRTSSQTSSRSSRRTSQDTPRQSSTRLSQGSITPRQGQPEISQKIRSSSSRTTFQSGYQPLHVAPWHSSLSPTYGRSQGSGSFYPPSSRSARSNLPKDPFSSSSRRPPDRRVGVVPGHNAPDVEQEELQANYDAWKAKVEKRWQKQRGR